MEGVGGATRGDWLRFRVDGVQSIGRHLVILVGRVGGALGGVDCVFKRERRGEGPAEDVSVCGTHVAHLSAWMNANMGVGTGRRACVAVRVAQWEGVRSKRGHWQVRCDALEIERWEDVEEERDLLDSIEFSHDGDADEDKSVRQEALLSWLETLLGGGPHIWKGLHVLDVGGGRGDLSALLTERGAHCILVDPRTPPEGREETFTRVREAFHWQSDAAYLRDFRVDLVVAMHADQGTEHAMRFALARGAAYCVIPCCVFAFQFPERRWQEGGVKKYTTFVRYLASLAEGVRLVKLPFRGRNICLYDIASLLLPHD